MIDEERLGKYMCYVLRHNPSDLGLELDLEGFPNQTIPEIVQLLRGKGWSPNLTEDEFRAALLKDDKGRFEVGEERVRALYGHSVVVDIPLDSSLNELPPFLYHGTQEQKQLSILEQGLFPGKRQYVHLSTNKRTAFQVATRRKGSPVCYRIDVSAAYQQGQRFRLLGNDTVLTQAVQPNLLEVCTFD